MKKIMLSSMTFFLALIALVGCGTENDDNSFANAFAGNYQGKVDTVVLLRNPNLIGSPQLEGVNDVREGSIPANFEILNLNNNNQLETTIDLAQGVAIANVFKLKISGVATSATDMKINSIQISEFQAADSAPASIKKLTSLAGENIKIENAVGKLMGNQLTFTADKIGLLKLFTDGMVRVSATKQ